MRRLDAALDALPQTPAVCCLSAIFRLPRHGIRDPTLRGLGRPWQPASIIGPSGTLSLD